MKQFFKMVFASCLGVILASGVVIILFFAIMGAFVNSVAKAFSSPNEKVVTLNSPKYLVIAPNGSINDSSSSSIFDELDLSSSNKKQYTLSDITRAIDYAKEEANIKGIILQLSDCSMGFAAAQEIRHHLQDYKDETGLPIYAYADMYGLGNYTISSLANKVYVNPKGGVMLQGLASNTLFYSGPLKKLGIEMDVFKVGTFKGAVEPYTQRQLSDANRLQIQTYLDGLWGSSLSAISESRNIAIEDIQSFADESGVFGSPERALATGLVDSLAYITDLEDMLAAQLNKDELSDATISIDEVLKIKRKAKKGDKVAIIFAEGSIVEGEDDDYGMNRSAVINRGLIQELRKVAADDDIKSVVLRVNSGGGSAFISELIDHEVQMLKKKKPIVVSMGDYAASGGYYISCHASKIFANPNTLTGSIGIFGMFPNATGLAKKIDLTHEVVKTAAMADLGDLLRPKTEQEKAMIQNYIEEGYDLFLSRVADGRNMSKASVDSIAQGRVWLGSKAFELGLVDQLGGLDDAVVEAARLAGLENYRVVYKTDKKSVFERLFNNLFDTAANAYVKVKYTPEERLTYLYFDQLKRRTGIQAVAPYDLEAVRLYNDVQSPFVYK